MKNESERLREIEKLLKDLPPARDARAKEEVYKRLVRDPRLAAPRARRIRPAYAACAALFAVAASAFLYIGVERLPGPAERAPKSEVALSPSPAEERSEKAVLPRSARSERRSSEVPSAPPVEEERSSKAAPVQGEQSDSPSPLVKRGQVGSPRSETSKREAAPKAPRPSVETPKTGDQTTDTSHRPILIGKEPIERARFALAEQDVRERVALHLAVKEEAATVPVTMLLDKGRVAKDFGGRTPSDEELFLKYGNKLDKEAFGFRGGEAVDAIARSGDRKVRALSAEEPAKAAADPAAEKSPYYVLDNAKGEPFLAPKPDASLSSVKEALQALPSPEGKGLKSAIPSDVKYGVQKAKDSVVVTFSKPLDLEKLPPKEADLLISALSLTAGSYNASVKLDNVVQAEWKGRDLKKPLPRPLGANGIEDAQARPNE